ncbi:MAG TPA: ATP-binding protein [Chthoniobacteraceae bacterium]|nr:ATP-binding protein [Chthoniobacteraceae bacterium]
MKFIRGPSVITKTLLQIGAVMTLILAAATAATYWTTLKTTETQMLRSFSEYALERSKRETMLFAQGEEYLLAMKRQFPSLLEATDDDPARFEAIMSLDSDGALRTRRDRIDPRQQASTWVAANTPVTPRLRRMIFAGSEMTERFFPAWSSRFAAFYLSSPLGFNTGISPLEPNWIWSLPGDSDQNSFDWYRDAAPERNPSRKASWSRLLPDETDQENGTGAYVTLSQPIDLEGEHVATLHLDVDLEQLRERTIQSERPGLEHLVVRRDGQLVASSRVGRELLKRGDYNLRDAGDSPLHAVFRAVTAQGRLPWVGYDPASDHYIAANRLPGPDWYFISLLKGPDLRQQAYASAKWILWLGLLSLALALLALARILRRQIALPLQQFLDMTRRMGSGETDVRVDWPTRDELGTLATAFNEMATRIAERDASLHRLNQELETRIAARTEVLRQSEERFNRAFHGSHALLAIIDLTTRRFLDANTGFLNTLGYSRDELLGEISRSEALPLEKVIPDAFLRRCLKEGCARDVETILLTKTGELRVVLLTGDRVSIGASDCILAAGTDITHRKKIEADTLLALQREKRLSELNRKFVAIVSHEFRTPLEMILSSTEILSRYLPRLTPDQRDQRLSTIQVAVRRMASFMEEVLLLGRFDAGHAPYHPEELHLAAWCRRLVREATELADEPREIRLEAGAFPPMAHADESLLGHIFTNLLSNALKYSPPDQPVTLRVRREGAMAVFEVEDHGIGIPPEDHARLFDGFYRGANVGKRPGTGIGLIVVKRCVEQHHGAISFQSRPGHGTTFTVRLPLFEADP